jgi:hypothetical protein
VRHEHRRLVAWAFYERVNARHKVQHTCALRGTEGSNPVPSSAESGANHGAIVKTEIQHRFEHAQWMSDASWSFAEAALGGTSYLRLPPLLQWFTGNIGFHDVDPRIPNYRLEECHNADARFQSASTLTLRTALRIVGQ